jgi:hypothetical protein
VFQWGAAFSKLRLMHIRLLTVFVLMMSLTACDSRNANTSEFVQRLRAHCGNAYVGKIVSEDADDDDWRSEEIIVAVQCTREGIRMPLHVGENRSRTWVLTRDGAELELRHDHRHEDGSEDALTQYGGFSDPKAQSGSRQNFPADESTKILFDKEDIPVSKQNTWAMEVRPSQGLIAYEMSRPERFFRIEFDTSKPVDLPPPEWGAEAPRPNGL